MTESRQFHLMIEAANRATGGKNNGQIGALPHLEVPQETGCLTFDGNGEAALGPQPEGSTDGFVVEPILSNHQSYLMMLSQGSERLRVNGHPAPPVAILSERDHIQVDDQLALHVTMFHRPDIGPPAPELIGKICPVCLTPFTAEPPTIVYRCWSCGCVAHCEGEEKPEDDRLECIKLSPSCPSCGVPVIMTHGYTYMPELNRD